MLILYFSGTGNTEYIARLFGQKTGGACLSIEDDADFPALMAKTDTLVICYPIYGSRIPRIMREFIVRHETCLRGKKLVILITQMMFSGDGARVLCDLLPAGWVSVIYAEHFFMPNNVCNFFLLPRTGEKSKRRNLKRAERKMAIVCRDIEAGRVKKRGFSQVSRLLGMAQGRAWQGNAKNAAAGDGSNAAAGDGGMEDRARRGIKIDGDCTGCGLCVEICPMKNLVNTDGVINHADNCTVCYRCVNRCPQRAITVFIHAKPKWQYEGCLPKNP